MSVEAYKKVEIETKVFGSSKYELILLMYERTIQQIELIKEKILAKDHAAKAFHVEKAMMIISDGLRASLDEEKGGQLSSNLFNIYTFINSELVSASVQNDPSKVDGCLSIMKEIQAAWLQIGATAK